MTALVIFEILAVLALAGMVAVEKNRLEASASLRPYRRKIGK